MVATTVAFFMTLFRVFDIPVFWPVLVGYFCVLFFLTMKRQIMVRPSHGSKDTLMAPFRHLTSLLAPFTKPCLPCSCVCFSS